MPDKHNKNNDDLDIDGVLGNSRLEELRKKYATVDDNGSHDLVLPAQENNDASDEPPFTAEPDEAAAPDDLEHETERILAESIQDIRASFRFIYEQSSKSVEEPPAQAISISSPVSFTSIPEQNETENPADTPAESSEHTEDNSSVKEKPFKRFAKNFFPCKGDRFGEILRKTILNIAVLTMLVCGGILFNIYVVAPYVNSSEAQKTIQLKADSDPLADWATIKDKYPGINFPAGMQPKFADLFASNKDFVGWLDIPGTGIELPVVKGKDNAEYLRKSFYGENSKYGCCFVDSNNGIAELDRNTIIYGHNMKSDNLMLGPLVKHQTIDGFKAAPLITFSTINKDTKWKIYAVFITNGSDNGDDGYLFNYIFRNLSDDDAFGGYIKQIDQRKLYTTGVDILPGDKILTISTCVYDFKDARLAVVARMLRDGESEEVDLSKAVPSKKIRYPQAWYSAKGQTKPKEFHDRWSPN